MSRAREVYFWISEQAGGATIADVMARFDLTFAEAHDSTKLLKRRGCVRNASEDRKEARYVVVPGANPPLERWSNGPRADSARDNQPLQVDIPPCELARILGLTVRKHVPPRAEGRT